MNAPRLQFLHIFLLSFAALIASTAPAKAEPSSSPAPVAIESGQLQGASKDGVLAFKGVPFAAPPVKDLRWRPPQPVQPWSGIRPSTEYANDPMQKPFGGDAAPLGMPPAEDCLYLNVWCPAAKSATPLPVIVWIYGGGFVNGGSSPAVYDGSQFAKDGLVFVSMNYRLARFGFFAHPALAKENSDEPHGNYGYMDQIAALKWVQRNIAAFGGDPQQVTVFGESAGGLSVHMLLTSPAVNGLFHRAIIQSGGGRNMLFALIDLTAAEAKGVNFAAKKGISGEGPDALAKLLALPPEEIVDGISLISLGGAAATYSGPVIDGQIVTTSNEKAYRSGAFAHVPVMVGTTSADLGYSRAKTLEEVFVGFGAQKEKAALIYNPDGKLDVYTVGSLVARDSMMTEPARFVAKTFSAAGVPTFEYRFSYVADSLQPALRRMPEPRRSPLGGAAHASDIPYTFNTVAAKYQEKLTEKDVRMAELIHAFWVNFAKTSNPNGVDLPEWPRYTADEDAIMDFAANGQLEVKPDPLRQRLDLTEHAANSSK